MSHRTLNFDDTLYAYLLDTSMREIAPQIELRRVTAQMRNGGMQISPEQGQLMGLLVRLMGARKTLEIGVFTGYSAMAVALALPADGTLLACDISDEYVAMGRPFWAEAGIAQKIDVRIGPAVKTLQQKLDQGEANTYDFAFIDADKSSYDAYFEACMQLVRPGGLIAIDNVLWGGSVAHPADDIDTRALQALNAKLHHDARIDVSLLPIGDGLTLARKH